MNQSTKINQTLEIVFDYFLSLLLKKNVNVKVKLDSVFSLLLHNICHEDAMRFQLSSKAQGIITKAHRWTRCTACSKLPSHHTTSCLSSSCKGNMASARVFSFSPSLFPSLPHKPHHSKPAAAALSPDKLLVMDAVLSSDTLAASHYYVQGTAGRCVLIQSQRVQSEERVMRLRGGTVHWSSQCFTHAL